MQRAGASREVWERYGIPFNHPHNAYLEWTVDNGLLGAIPVFLFFGIVLWASVVLLKSNHSVTSVATGGIGMAFVLGQLVASLASQSFYPRQGVVLMWCALALTLRFYVEVKRAAASKSEVGNVQPRALRAHARIKHQQTA
jgi:O-antigen ligase